MVARQGWLLIGIGLGLALLPSCTVLRVTNDPDAKGVRAGGLIRGHATVGISAEDRLVNVRLLGGSNRGAVAEVVLWKLFRLEAGVAGLSVGIGPFHVGLGSLFYRPHPPELKSDSPPPEPEECEETEESGGEAAGETVLRLPDRSELRSHPDRSGLETSYEAPPPDAGKHAA